MIKAVGTTPDGKPVLLLGLSGENLTRLMADQPIKFNIGQLGLPDIEVLIVGGPTESDIVKKLTDTGLITATTTQTAEDGTGPR
jgi:hypothetical protein